MNRQEFIESICDSMKISLIEKLKYMPDNWDGFEIRQYIEDFVKDHVNYKKMTGKRMRDYKNDCLVRPL